MKEMAGDLNISMTRAEPFEFPAMARSRLGPRRGMAWRQAFATVLGSTDLTNLCPGEFQTLLVVGRTFVKVATAKTVLR